MQNGFPPSADRRFVIFYFSGWPTLRVGKLMADIVSNKMGLFRHTFLFFSEFYPKSVCFAIFLFCAMTIRCEN
jgi:hypothetical protein